jgi:hypothetical protein
MANRNRQILLVCILLIAGLALCAYGAIFHKTTIYPEKDETGTPAVKHESAIVKEVTVSGLKRDITGKIRQTYTGKPPEACAT